VDALWASMAMSKAVGPSPMISDDPWRPCAPPTICARSWQRLTSTRSRCRPNVVEKLDWVSGAPPRLGRSVLPRRLPGALVLRWLFLVCLAAGLTAVSVIDADGDPTTTDVPSVVLAAQAHIPAKDEASHSGSQPNVPDGRKKLTVLCRRVGEWLGVGQHRWNLRVRPIRGP